MVVANGGIHGNAAMRMIMEDWNSVKGDEFDEEG